MHLFILLLTLKLSSVQSVPSEPLWLVQQRRKKRKEPRTTRIQGSSVLGVGIHYVLILGAGKPPYCKIIINVFFTIVKIILNIYLTISHQEHLN